jgi:curved DNA-binding protein CbpA
MHDQPQNKKQMFQDINNAYEVLSNSDLKQKYDDLIGNIQAAAFTQQPEEVQDEDSFYQRILKQRKTKNEE